MHQFLRDDYNALECRVDTTGRLDAPRQATQAWKTAMAERVKKKARPTETPWKPTRTQIAAAHGAHVPDVIAPRLKVLFVGINPGLYSGAVGHHFARPGNRFWPALFAGGFTDRLLSPFEENRLLDLGCGITNLVDRATATADALTSKELIDGARRLAKKIRRYRPAFAAIVGITAYRTAFQR